MLLPAVSAAPQVETPNSAVAEPLQVGDRGDEVLILQQKLSQMGYVVGSMDGVYGDVTAEAVKMLQRDKKIAVDGKVTPELYRLMVGRDLPVSRGAPVATVRRLIQTSFQHIGVPYWFGGNTPRGFDCSGFTRYVFANVGISLPRMADGQFAIGRPVSAERLQSGDLVFFETYEPGPSHVGIYIGNGQFISATSSRGVAVADLFGHYWGERYLGARRVL
jgi:peptidoglycan hydrolase-like protein with peptidoglycan-binding domain